MRTRPITGAMLLGLLFTACTYRLGQLGPGGPDAQDAQDAQDALSDAPADIPPRPDRPSLPPLAPTTVARTALLAYWPLDEARGGYTWDFTGNGNDGVLLPYPDPVHDIVGPDWRTPGFKEAQFPNEGQLFFDGIDDFVEFDPLVLPAIELPKSISLWTRYDYDPPATGPAAALLVMLNRDSAAGIRIELFQQRLRVSTYFMNEGARELVAMPAPPQGNHHIVYTFDGTTHALHVDGAEPVTSTVVHGEMGTPKRCRIGKSSAGVADAFKGFLDDVRIYGRALTPDEVQALHAGAP